MIALALAAVALLAVAAAALLAAWDVSGERDV